jgi:hypothetical protein
LRKLRENDVVLVLSTVEKFLPLDKPPTVLLRQSLKGAPCVRYQAETKSRQWSMDVYGKKYVLCSVPPQQPVIVESLTSLVLYLCRELEVRIEC